MIKQTDIQALPIPAPSQSCAPSISAPNRSHDQQQDQGADGGIDDRGNSARLKADAALRQQPTANESAGNSDNQIADQPEAGTLHDLTRESSGNGTNNEYDQQAFTRHVHRAVIGVIEVEKRLKPRALSVLTGAVRTPFCYSAG